MARTVWQARLFVFILYRLSKTLQEQQEEKKDIGLEEVDQKSVKGEDDIFDEFIFIDLRWPFPF